MSAKLIAIENASVRDIIRVCSTSGNRVLTMAIVRFKGVVESLTRELIPKIYLARIRDDEGKYIVEMDLHEELFVVPKGAKVEFSISREKPDYRDGVDFLGRATFVTKRKVDEHNQYLFSIGGLLVIVTTKEELEVKPVEKVYVKLAQID